MKDFFRSGREWLQHPFKVLLVCAAIASALVVLDGALFRIWSLNRDHQRLAERIEFLKKSVADKERRIQFAAEPQFIERQVREQLDFVRDGDLVFVFSDASMSDAASR